MNSYLFRFCENTPPAGGGKFDGRGKKDAINN